MTMKILELMIKETRLPATRAGEARRRLTNSIAADLCRIRRERIVSEGDWNDMFDAVSDVCRETDKTAVREEKENPLAMLIRHVASFARTGRKEVCA